ncbi:MAG: FtsQ-type POTRA domain-containing protein [Candidatus Margulisiibacteriota bacterium]|nr:FtsQ-type POTRA domain-containing protein [Candidatus Margulisiibacteriota bacterium]
MVKKRLKRKTKKKPRPRSIRILAFIISVLVLLGIGIYILSLPIFDIRDVVVNGTRMLSADEVRALAGIPMSENLFFTNFSRAEENLGKIAAIKEVRVYRIPPATVLISVKEREPIAMVVFPKKSVVTSRDGHIINRNPNITLIIPNMAELPVISGINEKEALKNNRIDKRISQLISEVILKLSEFMESERMRLEVGGMKDINLVLDDLLKVKIGSTEKIKRKMSVFVALLPVIAGKWSSVEYVDVRFPDNPVIKFK